MPHRFAALSLALLMLCATPAPGLVNGEAPANDDKRFDAVAAFSRTKWLIDDPGDQVNHNWFGSGVLIAPDVILTAKHLIPVKARVDPKPGIFTVRFRRHTDGSLGTKKAGPGSFHQVSIARWVFAERHDLALGILAKPVKHIEPVRVMLEAGEIEERECVLAGWGSESPWRGQAGPRRGLRVGENTAKIAGTAFVLQSSKTELREHPKDGQRKPYVVSEEALPNLYDSGGSFFFLDEEGKPVLAGIIATYNTGPFLPAAQKDGFPIEAGTKGAKALIAAVEAKRQAPPE